jgi:hypothetical protein
MNIFYPTFVLLFLTAFVALRLGYMRFKAVEKSEVDPRYYKLYRGDGEPDYLCLWTRHLANLLEVPVLFYVVTLIAFVTGQTSTVVVAMCWAYVAARCVHTTIHLTSNKVLYRFMVFGLSWLVLVALMVMVLV